MGLTTAECQQFHDLGYVVKEDIYSQADLQPLKDGLTAVIDQTCATLQEEGLLGAETFAAEPFETRLGALFKADVEVGERVTRTIMGHGGGGFKEQAILDFLRHPPLVSCIESLVGPDIIGSSVYRIRPKAPGYSRGAVPWHQDSGYFMPHCDGSLIVTCWIPLIDATIANGCLYVLPKSHRSGVYRHYTGGQGGYLEIAGEDLPAPEPVACPMRAGSVLFMTNLTPHASFENNTDIVRWSVDLRYQDAEIPNNIDEDPADFDPEREPVTMACWPGEGDFVIKDAQNPEREITDIAKFKEIRIRYEQTPVRNPGRGWTPFAERQLGIEELRRISLERDKPTESEGRSGVIPNS